MMMSGSMISQEQQKCDPYDWIVDSGASRHVTPFKFLFESLSLLPTPTTVTFGNGQAAPAAGQGNIVVGRRFRLWARALISHTQLSYTCSSSYLKYTKRILSRNDTVSDCFLLVVTWGSVSTNVAMHISSRFYAIQLVVHALDN
jgi:hypothetical protein